MNPLGQARALYAAGRLREAGSLLSDLLRRNPADAEAMQLLGAIQFQSGFPKEGLKLAERATSIAPANGEAWNNLGLMRHMMGQAEVALEAFARATAADPNLAEAWKNRGFLLQSEGRHQEALSCFERAGDAPDVHFFRGNALSALGHQEPAVAEFDRVIELDPNNGDAWHNRGNSLLALGQEEAAAESLRRAIKRMGKDSLAHCNLAVALERLGRADEALAIVDQVLRWDPGFEKAQVLRAVITADLEELDRVAREGSMEEERGALARNLQSQGKWRLAVDCLKGSKVPAERFLRALLMPAIFESEAMADEAFAHLEQSLDGLQARPPHLDDPLTEVGITTFHLPYFAVSDRPIQEQVASIYLEAAPSLRFEAAHSGSGGSRIRIGILSALLTQHTISRVFGGLIERLDKERFEVVYLQLGKSDECTGRIVKAADRHVRVAGSLVEAREQIAREELDVLFYPEIGMDPETYYLALSRLAPVQATIWGHPFTTGSPVMDHYISSVHLEREDGQAEYTERLALMPDLTMYYARPVRPPEWHRASFGLPENRRLYGCPQMPYKFHPHYDRVLHSIVESDDKGVIVLVEPQHPEYRKILLERWGRTHPLLADRVVWMPPMALENFLRLQQLCDAILAPIQFGAGRSTFDALGVGAPVVTHKGPYLKSRITYAAYREIGLTDLIAETEESYVELALRLANDRDWQAEMRRAVTSKAPALYESRKAVAQFNDFLASIAP